MILGIATATMRPAGPSQYVRGPRSEERRAAAQAARDATFAFLGRLELCGVGLNHDAANGSSVSFLLRRDSTEIRAILAGWTRERGVSIQADVAAAELVPLDVPA